MQGNITTQQVIESYQQLTSSSLDIKRSANNLLINILHRDQAWIISRQLIINQDDPNYQVLGSQILYQKVSQQLQDLTIQSKCQLRNFIFNILENQAVTLVPLIDKLVSALSLLICTMILKEWNNFMDQLMLFMKKSPNCLKNGLFLLERIPEELRNTNRIAMGLKKVVIDEFFKYQENMADIFLSVLNMNASMINPQIHKQLIKRDLNAMESWSKSRFSFLKYPQIIKQILIHSLQDFDKFQHSIVVIVQTIKSASINKLQKSLDSLHDPANELKFYTQNQITSIKLILQYVQENKNNFMSYNFNLNSDNQSMLEPEHRQAFLDIIKQSALNFGFLMLESIGFQLLDIVLYFTNSSDFRMSSQTFQFWIDMSEKMAGSVNLPEATRNQFSKYMIKLFQVINSKAIVESDYLLDDPQLKQDVTVDDPTALTFSQYRKQCSLIYQYIYNYYLKATKSPAYFFETCFSYILKDLQQPISFSYGCQPAIWLHKNTQLSLFCIKSSQQSMVSAEDSLNIRKILKFILQRISPNLNQNTNSVAISIKPRVSAQIYLLISECTREIKEDTQILYECLRFCMINVLDQLLCYYAARAFRCIVQAIDSVSDIGLVNDLVQFYSNSSFPKQNIAGEMLEGVFGMIEKLQNKTHVQEIMKKLITNIYQKFQKAYAYFNQNPQTKLSTYNQFSHNSQPSFFIPLLELKTLLLSYHNSNKNQFIEYFRESFQVLANTGLQMLVNIIPYCLNTASQKFIPGNQLSLSCSIFKSSIKICTVATIDIASVIQILQNLLGEAVLSDQTIVDMCPILGVFTQTLTGFMQQNTQNMQQNTQNMQSKQISQKQNNLYNHQNYTVFNNWIVNKMKSVNRFFLKNFQRIQFVDPDVIRWFFTIQQSIILYNNQIFYAIGDQGNVLDVGIHCIRHINQQKMQRKIISCLLICCKMNSNELQSRIQRLISEAFGAIPIINSINFHNLSKIFMTLLPYIEPEQKCAQFILHLLQCNPYTTIPQNIRSLLAQSFYYCGKTIKNERYLMIVCRDMQNIVINGEKNENQMQIQLRLNNWKRQAKRNATVSKASQMK